MYIILNQDVPNVGQKSSLVSVKRGYFLNYLQPRKLAQLATADMIMKMKETLVAQKEAAVMAVKGISEQASVLQAAKIVLLAKASKKGTLFRAIAEKTLANAIEDQLNIKVDPKNIEMEHIKNLGEHDVKIKMGEETVGIKVMVEAKEEEK